MESGFDEEAEIEAAGQRCAEPHPRDILRHEHEELLKGRPRDVALEKWGPEIEEMIARNLGRKLRAGK